MDGGVRGVAANGVLSDSQTNLGYNPRKRLPERFSACFRSVPQCCGGTVARPSETPWNTFQGHERTRRERERTFRHAVTTSRVPTMNQSDRTMPANACGRTGVHRYGYPVFSPRLGRDGRADMRKPAVLDRICWLTAACRYKRLAKHRTCRASPPLLSNVFAS